MTAILLRQLPESRLVARQFIEVAEGVIGRKVPVRYGARREGDPARLVADSAKARLELGWQPVRSDLPSIVADAWVWELGGLGSVSEAAARTS